jgi:hypothetical protein
VFVALSRKLAKVSFALLSGGSSLSRPQMEGVCQRR